MAGWDAMQSLNASTPAGMRMILNWDSSWQRGLRVLCISTGSEGKKTVRKSLDGNLPPWLQQMDPSIFGLSSWRNTQQACRSAYCFQKTSAVQPPRCGVTCPPPRQDPALVPGSLSLVETFGTDCKLMGTTLSLPAEMRWVAKEWWPTRRGHCC